jgi:DNA-binding transcriptional ArsR family regulator
MLRRLLVAALLLAPLLASGGAAAGTPTPTGKTQFTVSLDPTSLRLPAGTHFYANLTLHDPTTRPMTVDVAFATPNSTRLIVQPQARQVQLAANGTARLPILVTIPNATPDGTQPIVFTLGEDPATSPVQPPVLTTVRLGLQIAPWPTTGRGDTTPSKVASAPTRLPAPAELPSALLWAAGGAAAVGAGAGALALARRRWPWLLAPLYTRLAKARILEQPTRERIAEAVKAEPGITFGDLQRRLGLAAGSLTHHARKLEDAGVLFSSPDGQQRRFFHSGQGRVAAIPPLAERAVAMLSSRPMTLSELAAALGASKQAVHYHVKKLAQNGIVTATPEGALAIATTAARGAQDPKPQGG